MKQKLPALIFVIIIVIAGFVLYFNKKQSPSLQLAQKAESAGDLEKACALYLDAIYQLAPATALPDINRSKFITHEVLKNDVEKYIRAVCANNIGKKGSLTTAVRGLLRSQCSGKNPVSSAEPVVVPFTDSTFYRAWNRSFFAPEAKIDPSHASLASGNFKRNFSLLVVSSAKNYSYECLLLNKSSLQATKFLIPAENSARLYALPGEQLLICRSSVTFPNGELWKSAFAALPITMPQQSSEVTMELRTNVVRK